MEFLFFLLAGWLAPVICGGLIGERKGQLASGLVWTILLGWLGFIILLCLPDRKKAAADELAAQYQLAQWQRQQQARQRQTETAFLRYYLHLDGVVKGPYALAQVQGMWRNGTLTMDTLCLQEGTDEWMPLTGISDLLGNSTT
ncbi:MAG: DUF4339 domain-containing protein [Verrucomicrobiales bacterium]|jgi:hypothetical protein|nr:DUF4339 domain-containing protein [Verrucomicrobiales bacterium]